MTTRKRRGWKADRSETFDDLDPEPVGFPEFEHSSFTFEGEIERLGAIGRNRSRAPRWARIVARVVALAMLLPFALALIFFVVGFFRS